MVRKGSEGVMEVCDDFTMIQCRDAIVMK